MKPSHNHPGPLCISMLLILGCGNSDSANESNDPWSAALQAHEAGEFEKAEAHYAELLGQDLEHQGAWFNRSQVLLELGRLQPALEAIDEALRLAPKDIEALVHRARIHLTSDQPEFGLADLRAALEHDPLYGPAYQVRGDAWLELGEGEAAVIDYSHALRIDPFAEDLLEARALAFEGLGNPEEAELDRWLAGHVAAVVQEPEALEPRLVLAQAFLQFGEIELALEQAEWVLEREQSQPEARVLRGHARWLLGEQAGALGDYTHVIEGGSVEAVPAYLARASVYQVIGAEAEALRDLKAAQERAPENREVWSELAWLLATAKDAAVRDGEAAWEWASALEPNAEEPWRPDEVKAAARAALGQWEPAQTALRSAIQHSEGELRQVLEARLAAYGQRRTE